MRKIRGNTVGTSMSPKSVSNKTGLAEHLEDKYNPHQVTCEQIGAVTELQYEADLGELRSWAEGEILMQTESAIVVLRDEISKMEDDLKTYVDETILGGAW